MTVVALHPIPAVRAAHIPDLPAPELRPISALLTQLLPRCVGWPIQDPRRWRVWRNARPEAAVRELLQEVERDPAACSAQETSMGLALLAPASGFPAVPVAMIKDGLTAPELDEILQGLAHAGWRPTPRPFSPNA